MLVKQALSLDPALCAIYIRMQETIADNSITDRLVEQTFRAGHPRLVPRNPSLAKGQAV